MTPLNLTPDELLSTTRTVRKRLDLTRPVEPELLEECIDLAFQAPSGGNLQGWHFMLVTDADRKKALAELYRKSKQ
jgi:nitroreductase